MLDILSDIARNWGRRFVPPGIRQKIGQHLAQRGAHRRSQIIEGLLRSVDHSGAEPIRILMWEPGGMDKLLEVSALIATALRFRGCEVHLVMCDGTISGCVLREHWDHVAPARWPEHCPGCVRNYRRAVDSFALPHSNIGDYVDPARRAHLRMLADNLTREEIFLFQHEGVAVGRLAASGTIRYYRGIDWEEAADGEAVLREYLYSALIVTEAAKSAIDHFKPDYVLMSHDFYVDWGPAMSLAVGRQLPVVNVAAGYWPVFFFFHTVCALDQRDPHTISEAGWRQRQARPLTPKENDRLDAYFKARFPTSLASWLPQPEPLAKQTLFQQLAPGKPVWCLFTHINWDEVFNFTPMAFATPNDWLLASIRAMEQNSQISWLIKIHPGETAGSQNFSTIDLLQRHFPRLPEHIHLIPPDAPINPYDLISRLDGGITVCGTIGLELAVHGKPVILGGAAHYGGKGFTHDGLTKEAYLQLLDGAGALPPLSREAVALARQYAYSFFIQRQFKLKYFPQDDRRQPVDFARLAELLPGRDPEIDKICAHIVAGEEDFLLEEEAIVRLVDLMLPGMRPPDEPAEPASEARRKMACN